MMWVALICGLVVYKVVKFFVCGDDDVSDIPTSSNDTALFSVADRLQKLYAGGKVFAGLQIPDPDSASRQNIDLVLVTNGEAMVIVVKNDASKFVSVEKDGTWVCAGSHKHKSLSIPDPVAEAKQKVSILQSYLEQRGIDLPEGFLSYKVICPNPDFCTLQPNSFPSEVITYDQWVQLKPETTSSLSGWFKGALRTGKKEMQESITEKLKFVLSTAPTWDRLELKGNKYILGEFLEFKGKQVDTQALRNIKRSKVSRLIIQKTSMFGLSHSEVQVLYSPRDYHADRASSSEWKELKIRSSTEVLFQQRNASKVRKFKLSSVTSLDLSA